MTKDELAQHQCDPADRFPVRDPWTKKIVRFACQECEDVPLKDVPKHLLTGGPPPPLPRR